MSLIICSECGKEISDKSSACIHCGCPIEKIERANTTKKLVFICMGACLSNPFKEFDEYTQVCPDCGGQLSYYETQITDNDTDLVVEHYTEEFYKNMKKSQQQEIECPYCHSTNTKKISTFGRVFSTEFLGLGSGKVGKQWHCNKCNSDF